MGVREQQQQSEILLDATAELPVSESEEERVARMNNQALEAMGMGL